MTTEEIRTGIRTRQLVRLEYAHQTASAYVLEAYVLFYDPQNRLTLYGHIWGSDPHPFIKGSRDFLVEHITSVELLDAGYRRPQPDYFDRDLTKVRIVSDVYCSAGAP
jgi:hypothetical protein